MGARHSLVVTEEIEPTSVGLVLGEALTGALDGVVVGDDVTGAAVGVDDGDEVTGALVGKEVGAEVTGAPVGLVLGDEVAGAIVGSPVGDEVTGARVGCRSRGKGGEARLRFQWEDLPHSVLLGQGHTPVWRVNWSQVHSLGVQWARRWQARSSAEAKG